VSAWVNVPFAVGGLQTFTLDVSGGITGSQTITTPTDGWVRMSITGSWAAGSVFVHLFTENVTVMTAYVDAVQIESGSAATAYMDGTLGNGHTWAGTAHASTTTRAAGVLTYNTAGVINQRAGSIMAWVYPTEDAIDQMVFSHFAGGDEVFLRANASGDWDYTFSSVSGSTTGVVTANAWQHVAMTWEADAVKVYLNGEQIASNTISSWAALSDAIAIGHNFIGPANHWLGLIDDVVILGRASPPDEVRAVYESNAPVFAETSTWQWRAGRNRIYADAEGLWGLGASGGTILGLYAGSEEDPAATKSWGGLSLSEGDFLLGQYGTSKGGWMLFNQDLVGGLPAWVFGWGTAEVLRLDNGGASLTGVLDIDSAGGIYQGTGTFASPTTGLKIWNSSGVGMIGGYSSGVAQWYGNTDGKLYAGGGNVMMDANGVTIATKSISAWETFPATNSVRWQRSGTAVAGISSQYWSAANLSSLVMSSVSDASGVAAEIFLQTFPFGGGVGSGPWMLMSTTGTGFITLNSGGGTSFSVTDSGMSIGGTASFTNVAASGTLSVSGTTSLNAQTNVTGQIAATLNDASVAPLFLANSLGPYMFFNNGMSGAALGAYQGKIPIRIGFTIYYLPVYA
jgi:hypothetical protein